MTHPPTGPDTPTSPTGPGRDEQPGNDPAVDRPVGRTYVADPAAVDALIAQATRPPIGQVIRSTETYVAQALAVLERDVDPASLGGVDPAKAKTALLSAAGFLGFARTVLATLAEDGALAPVGSAVQVPGGRKKDGPRTAGTAGVLNTNTNTDVEQRR